MSFAGFPPQTRFTPVPDPFINQLAPAMTAAEIALMLIVFNVIFNKKGSPRHVTASELTAHPSLVGQDIKAVLLSLVERGLLLPLTTGGSVAYFLNNPEGRQAVAKTEQVHPEMPVAVAMPPVQTAYPTNIFALYEANIGPLTPLIAEELKDALDTYPEEWLHDAMKEAASLNKRSWRYIQRILERWVAEGRNNHGTYRSDTERDKFIHGRYGKLVQR